MEKAGLTRLGKDIEGVNPSGTFEFGGEKFFAKEIFLGPEAMRNEIAASRAVVAMGNDAVPVVKRGEFIVSWEDLHQHVH